MTNFVLDKQAEFVSKISVGGAYMLEKGVRQTEKGERLHRAVEDFKNIHSIL